MQQQQRIISIIVPTIIEPITINTIATVDKTAVTNLWTSLSEAST